MCPGHAIASWLRHSRKVSRKHYLMVSDEIFAMATSEKNAAVGPRTDSHDVTNAEVRKDERPALPVICEAMRGAASEADGTRTRNHRIDSPGVTQVHEPSNSFAAKRLANSTLSREFPSAAVSPDNRLICPELEVVIAAWPTLPETIKAEILAMARVANS